jgi:hypothetical protein
MAACCAIVWMTPTICGCNWSSPPVVHLSRTAKVDGTLVTLPEQGWSHTDAEWFYNVSQGSQLIPFEWAKALKTVDGTQLFIESLPQYNYIARHPSADNPLGLCIGFTKDQGIEREWLSMNCAACHTTVLEHGGKSYLIDGAPTLGDAQGMLTGLAAALEATANNPQRFDEFAKAVKGNAVTEAEKGVLKDELNFIANKRKAYNDRNMPKPDAQPFGHGRVDAIGAIFNEVTVRFLDEPRNLRVTDAPVSYPFLWDTPHHDKVQWNGSAPNTLLDLGNLARNVGEVLGVFGEIVIEDEHRPGGYQSTVQIRNLREIELKLERLKSPLWPSDIPRSKDPAVLAAGKKHFDRLCADCHKFEKNAGRDDEDRQIIADMRDVGTDPVMATNFRKKVFTGKKLEGAPIKFNPLGDVFGETADGETVLVHVVVGTILGGWKRPPPDELSRLKTRERAIEATQPPNLYKGRPLNGIWATAPYLHNGSVPTLRDLLKPATKRPKVFWVGSRKFDPVDVGFESKEEKGTSKFDTSLVGNSNAGHEYGTGTPRGRGSDGELLEAKEVDELLEYLKSL